MTFVHAQPGIPAPALRPHQIISRDAVIASLRSNDRALLVSACGTGKTVTLQSIIAARHDSLIVAFFPSLALVDQTLRSWRHWFGGRWAKPIVVCSDDTIGAVDDDEQVVSDFELAQDGAHVVRDPDELARALDRYAAGDRAVPQVVFATYQSSERVAEAQDRTSVWFDIAVFDEAHQIGPGTAFGRVVLDADRIRARKRLAATATPRVFHLGGKRGATERVDDWSLLDDTVYGPVAHEYGLRDAIDDGVLVDYNIHVIQIGQGDARRLIDDEALEGITLDPTDDRVRMALGLAALVRAKEKLGITRVIAYLRSKARAHEFASHAHRLSLHDVDVITGDMPMNERTPLLEKLADDGGVIANVRCLTEGVDIPRLDAVLFVDPRSAKVDVVQAVGRAIRRHDASGKTLGHVILPVLEAPDDADENWAAGDGYRPVWDVLGQMARNDSRLNTQLQQAEESEAPPTLDEEAESDETGERGEVGDDAAEAPESQGSRAPSGEGGGASEASGEHQILEVWAQAHTSIGLDVAAITTALRRNIALRTVDLITPDSAWMRRATELQAFVQEHGRWPVASAADPVERSLGYWLSTRRRKAESVGSAEDPDRLRLLDSLVPGWRSRREADWRLRADALGAFFRRYGRWPSRTTDDLDEGRLSGWLSDIRRRDSTKRRSSALSPERAAYLDVVAPGWRARNKGDAWLIKANDVAGFFQSHTSWPSAYSQDPTEAGLGSWLQNQRHLCKSAEKGSSSRGWTPERHAYLDRVMPGWMGADREATWKLTADTVAEHFRLTGRWPSKASSEAEVARIGAWLTSQRVAAKGLGESAWTPDREAYLDRIAPGWRGSGIRGERTAPHSSQTSH